MSKFLQSRGAVADEVVPAIGVPVVDLNPEMRKEEIKDDNNDDNADDGGDDDDNGDDGDDGDEEKDHWTKGLVGWDMVAPPTLVSHKTGNAKRIENHRHHLKIIVSPQQPKDHHQNHSTLVIT